MQTEIYRQDLSFEPEPGNVHTSQRLCFANKGSSVYFVNRQQLHRIQLNEPNVKYDFRPTKNEKIPFPMHHAFVSMESVYTNNTNQHDYVGVVANDATNRLLTVDTSGYVQLFNLNKSVAVVESENDNDHPTKKRKIDNENIEPTFTYNPSNCSTQRGELGWSGITFDPDNENNVVIGRHWYRDVHIVDVNQQSPQIIYTTQRPTSITYISLPVSHQSLLAVAETNIVNIWDMRTSKCVASCGKTRGTIYDLKSTVQQDNSSARLGIIGADRDVHIYDSKKWGTPCNKVNNSLKYAPSWMAFSSQKNIVYIAGIDNSEFKAADYTQTKPPKSSIYADSRWIGIDYYSNASNPRETIVGLSQTGSFYYIRPDSKSLLQ
jgi:hypothetical protein